MGYSEEQIIKFDQEYKNVCKGFQNLMLQTVVAGQELEGAGVKEHLLHGVARRLSVLKRSLENIFGTFPLTTSRPLDRNDLYDVQINLHAYVMNLYGIFDNWAWAFVYRHDILEQVGGKHGVGLFKRDTRKFLPQILREYLASEETSSWHEDYLKSFRDALAHRIPLYIPPMEVTKEEGQRYNVLESEKINLIKSMQWERLDELYEEQSRIGRPSFMFIHSYEEGQQKPMVLHPQILCDGLSVVEFGTLYMTNWHETAQT